MTNLIADNTPDLLATFQEYLGVYLEDHDIKPKTMEAYIFHLRAYYKYCQFEGIDPKYATAQDLRNYRNHLRESYKTSTIKLKLNILRRFYRRAIELGIRQDNPVHIKAKNIENNPEDEIKYFDIEEIKNLFASIKLNTPVKVRDYLILWIMYTSGLRVIEITRLNLSDIESNRLRVTGKNDKIRYVGLTPTTKELISNWLEVRENFVTPGEKALFISTSNRSKGRLSTRSIRYRIDHYLERIKAKKEGKSCHSLRHSFGTHAHTNGVSVGTIQSMLGHSSPDMTRLYAKISNRELIENTPSRILEDLLLPA